jgi:flagellin-like hook-associated protein FlgL
MLQMKTRAWLRILAIVLPGIVFAGLPAAAFAENTAVNEATASESIDNALATISNLQATLGAAQNRLTGIATSQQAE